jgi:hypothetical protein
VECARERFAEDSKGRDVEVEDLGILEDLLVEA